MMFYFSESNYSRKIKLLFFCSLKPIVRLILLLISCVLFKVNVCYAEDTLSSLMQRMKSDSAVRIEYQEIKELELLEQPWHGSGFMYSMPPDMMIREQIKPERILMGVKADKLYYFDTENNVRHQAEMDEENPMSLNIAMFKALMNGDEVLLHDLYQVDFSASPKRWVMHLIPKKNRDSGPKIVVSGSANTQADMIRINKADGDVTEFLLKNSTAGEEINKMVNQLYLEILGE